MCQSHRLKEDFSDMESLESSKRQEGLNFHLILPHPAIRECSAALGNPSVPADALPPKVRSPSTAALPKAVLPFREAELQEKMTFFEVAFYLQHETAGCSWRMWCRITILSIKTILKRYKVTWVLWGPAISQSWMPNLHSQGYKLSTAIQAPAWLKRNKPGASQSLSAFWNAQELSFSLHRAVLNPLVFQNLPTDTSRALSRQNSCSDTSHK